MASSSAASGRQSPSDDRPNMSEEAQDDEEDSSHKQGDQHEEKHKEKKDKRPQQLLTGIKSALTFNVIKLNLVLCGSNRRLKNSISKLILGRKRSISLYGRRRQRSDVRDQRELSSECVRREGEVCGRLISLVELPALNQLSEEEVMHQTLRCVSLCDPGVHVFLLIIPVGPLTDEDKAEMEKIKRFFDSQKHFMVLFTADESVKGFMKSTECRRVGNLYGSWYILMVLKDHRNSRQIEQLLECIEKVTTGPYSLQTYVSAQVKRVRKETEEKYKEQLKEMENKIKELQQHQAEDYLRIVLIGKTGNGKSETGNTILGREVFHSEASTDSVTAVCQRETGEVDGKSVAIVDTPGLFDTTLTNEQVQEEIVNCVKLSAPGPHVFIIVLSVGRITPEERDTLDLIKRIFGPKAAQFSIVLFTRGDDLEDKSIEDFVGKSKSAELKELIRDCGERYIVFNNREKQDQNQVTQLLNMIEEVKTSNHGQFFTNEMFEEGEIYIKRRVEKILREKEREIQTQQDELNDKTKIKHEHKNRLKRLEKQKQEINEKRVKMKSMFEEKEETLRIEFEEKEKSEQKKQETEYQKLSEKEKQQKAEYHLQIEEMKREMEKLRLQYENQQKKKETEDREREEKYKKDQEKMKNEQESIIAELRIKQNEEIQKKDLERQKEEREREKEREEWVKKIKEAENEGKDVEEELKQHQRECEEDKKTQMREREEEERKRKETHEEQLREKQEELDKIRGKFEREKEEERQKIEKEREQQQKKREQTEKEYEDKMNKMEKCYEQLEKDWEEEWERRKREDDERKEEERKRWEKRREDLKEKQKEDEDKLKAEELMIDQDLEEITNLYQLYDDKCEETKRLNEKVKKYEKKQHCEMM